MDFVGSLVNILSDGAPNCASNAYGRADESVFCCFFCKRCNRREGVYRKVKQVTLHGRGVFGESRNYIRD